MTEHELFEPLERLAEAAPAPGPGLAGGIVARGRTVRRRRRGAATVAAAAAVAAAVVLVPLLGSEAGVQDGETPVATAGQTTATEPTLGVPPGTAPDRVEIAAAGIEQLVEDIAGRAPRRLLVSDRVCHQPTTVYLNDDGSCTPWTEDAQAELADLLSDVAPVRFVPDDDRDLAANTLLVRVAALEQASEDRGSVFVFALVGFDGRFAGCGGGTYELWRAESGWRITGLGSGLSVIC